MVSGDWRIKILCSDTFTVFNRSHYFFSPAYRRDRSNRPKWQTAYFTFYDIYFEQTIKEIM